MENLQLLWNECKQIFDGLNGEVGRRPSPQLQSTLQALALTSTRRVLDLGRDHTVLSKATVVPKVKELQRHVAAMVRAISPVASSGSSISNAVIQSTRNSMLDCIAPAIQTIVQGLNGQPFALDLAEAKVGDDSFQSSGKVVFRPGQGAAVRSSPFTAGASSAGSLGTFPRPKDTTSSTPSAATIFSNPPPTSSGAARSTVPTASAFSSFARMQEEERKRKEEEQRIIEERKQRAAGGARTNISTGGTLRRNQDAAAEAENKRKQEEEAARNKADAERKRREQADEAERKRREQQDEADRRKRDQEEADRRRREEDASKSQKEKEDLERRRREQGEAERKRREQEDVDRKKREEADANKRQQQQQQQQQEQQQQQQKQQQEAAAQQEFARMKAQQDEAAAAEARRANEMKRIQEAAEKQKLKEQEALKRIREGSSSPSPAASPATPSSPAATPSSAGSGPMPAPKRAGNAWEQRMQAKADTEYEASREVIRERRAKAGKHVDEQIRSLIVELQRMAQTNGYPNPSGVSGLCQSVKFGELFAKTQGTMSELAATLQAAKKRGVIEYEGYMLQQGYDDDKLITLIKDSIKDSEMFKSKIVKPSKPQAPQGPAPCNLCAKTVYMGPDRLLVNALVFHKACFKCCSCNKILKLAEYSFVSNKYFCKQCFMREFQKAGGLNF